MSIPKLWCLKITPENIKDVGRWRECGSLLSHTVGGWVISELKGARGYFVGEREPNFPKKAEEISTEEFYEHILKRANPNEKNKIDNSYSIY